MAVCVYLPQKACLTRFRDGTQLGIDMERTARRTMLLLVALTLLAAACGSGGDTSPEDAAPSPMSTDTGDSAGAGAEATDQTLTIGVSSLLEVFDPSVAQPVAKVHLVLMYDHLVGVNADATDVSKETGLFQDWTTEDSQTWTFTMREGSVFHNGEPVTAEDVKFSLDRLQDEATATSAYSTWFRGNIESVEVTGDLEVTIRLTSPSFQLPLYLSPLFGNEGSVIPKAYFEEVGPDGFEENPIGSGPYRLARRTPGVSLVYELADSPHPVVTSPRYSTVEFRVVEETGSRVAQLETGELDVIDVGTAQAAELRNSDAVTVIEKPAGNQVGITFHQQWNEGSPLGDEQIRQALAIAVNAEDINEAIFGGLGHVTGNYPGGPLSIGFEELAPYPFDPDQARQLLQSSGYDGTTIKLYAFPLPGVPELPDLAEVVQSYWADIGVNVELVPTEFSSFVQDWVGYTLDVAASPVAFAHRPLGLAYYENGFWSQGGSTVTHDPEIDAMVDQGRAAAADEDAYGKVTAELNRYVYDNYLSLPIIELNSFYAARTGIEWSPGTGQYDINARDLVAP